MGKRNIISTYDLTLEHGNFDSSEKLNFFVDDTNVNDINNRYTLKASLSQVKLRVGLHRLKNISGLVML